MNLYDWEYEYHDGQFNVIPPFKIKKPNAFFKYYALDKKNVDAVTQKRLYASHPAQLNDLVDCNIRLFDFDVPAFNRVVTHNILPYCKMTDDELMAEDVRLMIKRSFFSMHFSKWGVFSMAPTAKNWLMWSLYSGNNGFCVEFDVEKFAFKKHGPFPMNYQKELRTIRLSEFMAIKEPLFLAFTNIKHERWRFEEEWRLICDAKEKWMDTPDSELWESGIINRDRFFDYSDSAIKSITFGICFFDWENAVQLNESTLQIKFSLSRYEQNKSVEDTLKIQLLDFALKNDINMGVFLPKGLNEVEIASIKINGGDGEYTIHFTGDYLFENKNLVSV